MTEGHKVLRRTAPLLFVGLLAFVLYLALFVDVGEMIAVMQRADKLIYFFAALVLGLEAFFFTLTWQYLLRPLSVKVPLRKTFAFVLIGTFADLLVPAESVSGEIAKTYLMSREPDVNPGKVVASLLSQRMLGTITTTATLCICFLALLTANYSVSTLMLQILLSVAVVSAVAFAFLVIVCFKEEWTENLIVSIMGFIDRVSKGRFHLARFQTKIVEASRAFYESLRIFGSRPSSLIMPIIFNSLTWLSSITIVFLVFVSIGYLEPNLPVLLLIIAAVYTLLVAVKSIPIGIPAEVGLPDIIMTTLFSLFGIPLDISAAATILTRILTVWLRLSIGLIAVQLVGLKSLMESGALGKTKNKV